MPNLKIGVLHELQNSSILEVDESCLHSLVKHLLHFEDFVDIESIKKNLFFRVSLDLNTLCLKIGKTVVILFLPILYFPVGDVNDHDHAV